MKRTTFKRNWRFTKRFETKLLEAHWIFNLLFSSRCCPESDRQEMGLLQTSWGCTVLPINTQGCEAFSWDPPRLRLSAQQQASGSCSVGKWFGSWEAWAASWPPKCRLYCTAILFTTEGWHTISLLCNLAIPWRHKLVDEIHTHQTLTTLVFIFCLFWSVALAGKDHKSLVLQVAWSVMAEVSLGRTATYYM